MQMESPLLVLLQHAPAVPLASPRLDATILALSIESALKKHIASYRTSLHRGPGSEGGESRPTDASLTAAGRGHARITQPRNATMDTRWDDRLAYTITQALVAFEAVSSALKIAINETFYRKFHTSLPGAIDGRRNR